MKQIQQTTLGALALMAALFAQSTSAQVILPDGSSSYTQNFDSIVTGLPPGWSVRTLATTTFLGNVASFSVVSNTPWALTTGRFSNQASVFSDFGTNFLGNETALQQSNNLNRALAVRTTSSFGEPGGAFVFQILNTTNFTAFQLDLDGLLLSPQGRSNIWYVDYGVGANPSSFSAVGSYTNPATGPQGGVFGATHGTFSFGSALDHQADNVWIRIVTFGVAGGSGSRPTFGIDNFNLAYTYSPVQVTNPPTIPTDADQPQSRTNNAGTAADFVVNVSGTSPLYFQWYKQDGTQLYDAANILGSATAHLQVTNVTADDGNGYYVVINNNAPANNVITSLVATLTVIDPVVTTQPNNQTNVAGDTGDFFVAAAGYQPLAFQWLFNGTDLIDYGITSALDVPNVQAKDEGDYSAIVMNAYGTMTTSAVAHLTVLTTPSTRLARWDFNASNTLDRLAPAPSFGSGTASTVTGTNSYFASGTYSDPAGLPGPINSGWNTQFYPPQGTSNKQYGVQFNLSTVGYQNVMVTWEERHSASASKYIRLQYTTNGTDWIDGDVNNMSVTMVYQFMSSDLSAKPGVRNNPNFGFRLVSEWESTAIGTANTNYVGTIGAYGSGPSGGTIRYDLVTVFGDVYVAPLKDPPTIPTGADQPQSRTNNAGTTADFVVNASGTAPLYFQWYKQDGTQLHDLGNILGSTTTHLQVTNVTVGDATGYYVVITNDAPANNVITSVVATLTVIDPVITTQPNNRTNLVGDNGGFYVGAAGYPPLSFQWLFNGTNKDNATGSSLNVTNLRAADAGDYSAIVMNAYGTMTTSAVAHLTIKATPSTRLARWDFNATNTLDPKAPVSSFGSGTAATVTGTNAYFAAGTDSDPAGLPGTTNSGWNTQFYPPQGTSNKQYGVKFNLSTVGYKNILVTWEQRHSASASKYLRLQYTTNGTDWIDGDVINMSVADAFQFMSSDLSATPGVKDNPNFGFRLVAEWESTAIGNANNNYAGTTSTYGSGDSGGTIRYDLVTVFGDVFAVSPIPINIQQYGTNVVLSWTDPGLSFRLQSAPSVTGTYNDIPGAVSPYTNAISASQTYFRLKH